MAKNIKNLIRIANTDLNGDQHAIIALQSISGVNIMFANAVCKVLSIEKSTTIGDLDEKKRSEIETVLKDPLKYNIPVWLLNRRNEPETGEDKHLATTDVRYITDEDKKELKKMKSYIGLRHQWGLPVRGQRTGSNFRRSKAKATGGSKRK